MKDGRAAEIAYVSGQGIRATYTRVFQVMTDALVEDLWEIEPLFGNGTPGPDTIPEIGDAYPTASGSVVKSIAPETGDGDYQYFVIVNYDTAPSGGLEPVPTDQEWSVTTEVIEEEYVAEYDLGGHAGGGSLSIPNQDNITASYPALPGSAAVRDIANSADDLFDPPVMTKRYLRVYNLQKYIATWDEDEVLERLGKLNSDTFTFIGKSFRPWSLLCTRYNIGEKKEYDGSNYYSITIQLVHRPYFTVRSNDVVTYVPGWLEAVVDQGYHAKDGDQTVLNNINGIPATVPQLLDGSGARQLDTAYHAVYRQFRTLGEDAMGGWGLPTTT